MRTSAGRVSSFRITLARCQVWGWPWRRPLPPALGSTVRTDLGVATWTDPAAHRNRPRLRRLTRKATRRPPDPLTNAVELPKLLFVRARTRVRNYD
jgi:hypothetical protein